MTSQLRLAPIVVLVYDSPIARAYLQMFRESMVQPKTILVMVPPPRRWYLRLFPNFLRLRFLEILRSMTNNFYPRRLLKQKCFQQMASDIEEAYSFSAGFLTKMYDYHTFDRFSSTVQKIEVTGLDDPTLIPHIASCEESTILYTGGGIVPESILSLTGKQFLHIHPGFLPKQRGADGILWATMNEGTLGASAFFLGPGIDTGDLIIAKTYPVLSFSLPGTLTRPDLETLYRAIYSFYDPALRVRLLRDMLDDIVDERSLVGYPQDLNKGKYYSFMTSEERGCAMTIIFPEDLESRDSGSRTDKD